jgi:hypothetical protein
VTVNQVAEAAGDGLVRIADGLMHFARLTAI